jgi:hypothetical protein
MQIDVQLQNIEGDYQAVKSIKNDQKKFNGLLEFLHNNYRIVRKDAQQEIANIEKRAQRAALLNGNFSSATLGKSSSISKSIAAVDSRNKTFRDTPIDDNYNLNLVQDDSLDYLPSIGENKINLS